MIEFSNHDLEKLAQIVGTECDEEVSLEEARVIATDLLNLNELFAEIEAQTRRKVP